VTVVIPTYNWSSVLRQAVKSVLWQTYPEFELLVIGDACTDNSEEVVSSFGDPRVSWHNLERNHGCQDGPNNLGLDLARGKYVAYLGHDDVWHPAHLAHAVAALESSSADVAHTIGALIGPRGSHTRFLSGLAPDAATRLGLHLPPGSIVHTTEVGRRIGGWTDWRTIEVGPDTDLLDRLKLLPARFVAVRALTLFKFASSQRRNSYVERPSHEQERCMRRLSRPLPVERELLAVAAQKLSPLRPRTPYDKTKARGPGGAIREARRVRGLDP
jgi:glycosyltransferase involved in cell wall biosynthesis